MDYIQLNALVYERGKGLTHIVKLFPDESIYPTGLDRARIDARRLSLLGWRRMWIDRRLEPAVNGSDWCTGLVLNNDSQWQQP